MSSELLKCKWKGCSCVLDSTLELKNHIEKNHLGTNKGSYKCEWAGCSFGERRKIYDVKTHVTLHHQHLSHFCKTCGKGFLRDQELRKHNVVGCPKKDEKEVLQSAPQNESSPVATLSSSPLSDHSLGEVPQQDSSQEFDDLIGAAQPSPKPAVVPVKNKTKKRQRTYLSERVQDDVKREKISFSDCEKSETPTVAKEVLSSLDDIYYIQDQYNFTELDEPDYLFKEGSNSYGEAPDLLFKFESQVQPKFECEEVVPSPSEYLVSSPNSSASSSAQEDLFEMILSPSNSPPSSAPCSPIPDGFSIVPTLPPSRLPLPKVTKNEPSLVSQVTFSKKETSPEPLPSSTQTFGFAVPANPSLFKMSAFQNSRDISNLPTLASLFATSPSPRLNPRSPSISSSPSPNYFTIRNGTPVSPPSSPPSSYLVPSLAPSLVSLEDDHDLKDSRRKKSTSSSSHLSGFMSSSLISSSSSNHLASTSRGQVRYASTKAFHELGAPTDNEPFSLLSKARLSRAPMQGPSSKKNQTLEQLEKLEGRVADMLQSLDLSSEEKEKEESNVPPKPSMPSIPPRRPDSLISTPNNTQVQTTARLTKDVFGLLERWLKRV